MAARVATRISAPDTLRWCHGRRPPKGGLSRSGTEIPREIAPPRSVDGGEPVLSRVGAAAGAAIGNAIQNRTGTGYNIYVRLQDGRETVAMQDDLGDIRVGSYVRVVNGRAYLQ